LKDGLDTRITAFTISRNEANIEELDVETALTYTKQFIRNLARVWQDMREVKHKQQLQRLVLPEGIAYDKTTGTFRTAVLSPIFKLFQDSRNDESQFVAQLVRNWHQIIACMPEMQEFVREKSPLSV